MPADIYLAKATDKAPYYSGYRDAVHGSIMQQRNMDIIANNLANLNTPGYKADRLIFNDVMTRQVKTYYDQGSLRTTGNPLDVAISGEGFFQVRTPKGIRLTRDGSFHMKGDGTLVTSSGYPVLGGGGVIALNPEGPKPFIDEKGNISQGSDTVGRLSVVKVGDKRQLEKVGKNLFAGPGGRAPATTPATDYEIHQGALEMANVQVVREMVDMIAAFRGFESYQKAIRAMNEIDMKAATQVGQVF